MRGFLTLLGLICVSIGVWGWKTCRIGVVADRHGIWISQASPLIKNPVLWDDMQDLKKISWTSKEGEHSGIVVHFNKDLTLPEHAEYMRDLRAELVRLGKLDWHNFVVLSHDEWDWSPDDFMAFATKAIQDPYAREDLDEYVVRC